MGGRLPKSGTGIQGALPKVVRSLLRDLLETDGVLVLQQTLSDPQASRRDKLYAVDLIAKYGLGSRVDTTFEDGGGRTGVVLLPVQDGALVEPSGNGDRK